MTVLAGCWGTGLEAVLAVGGEVAGLVAVPAGGVGARLVAGLGGMGGTGLITDLGVVGVVGRGAAWLVAGLAVVVGEEDGRVT